MRTCPACGEDTDAGYAEACTKCGFSPTSGDEPAAEPTFSVDGDDASTFSVGPERPADDEGTPTPGDAEEVPPPPPPPAGESAPKRKRSPARMVIWLVAIVAIFAVDKLGVFDPAPGPDPDAVETAIVDNAAEYGATVTVACPDDADQTEVDATFTCTVTPRRGPSFPIEVTNREDTFSWPSDQFATLN